MMKLCNESYDVIVIGAGGGGLRSAIGAAQEGAKTLVICRGRANRSGATLLRAPTSARTSPATAKR